MNKDVEAIRTQLLQCLSDGQFHSGEALGHLVGLSRAAISNHVKALRELGLDIFRVTGKGYRLASALTLLDRDAITENLSHPPVADIEVLNIIDSTNTYLKDRLAQVEPGHVCLAEAQTAGRGRQGRQWISPFGASLYVSLCWRFPAGYQSLNGLSLAIGIAVARALKRTGIDDVQLKWPNDVYWQGRKLAGVLIEVEGQMGGACDVVIGLGLNVQMPTEVDGITQPWADLYQALGETVDRNQLSAWVIEALWQVCEAFASNGFAPLLEEWHALDYFRDQPVTLLSGQRQQQGICRGVNAQGALLLEQGGQITPCYGGEISVRGQ
ncbi:bifunctional biotin--[acetyl-CoA-carboxylase] ligase/biotin operon repressor BirA [Aestuariibacter halophilus]|uniref:Bifunctional ligase/repressor BirA n=1 Tax=Fluctibacter halophilus TaxID=226011 RepID=A0ABS8GDJ4_9ALTE|nr:bifunctional biotin--[acetyl-CoA-carboxylase] ligase/biotin operon repressor BirA [Aestuariibacter halophilus]MCC2618326.1 bifunctional biotin--[acetyl-CoA-carboxylase] ligase/biotin operon repressor BirA [Aestuariibacter halophilus]